MIGIALNNRYHIESELGRGGMGVVYRAHDARLKRDVAVKILSAVGLGTEGRARLMNEAQAAARLNHPNIVAVHDAGEAELEPGRVVPFVVMELLDGQTLQDRPPATLEETLALTRQLCAALDHAHRNGVIHRDLKPENIMRLGRQSTVKLMDFGLAQSVASRLTGEGAIMGTLFYLAPEMIQAQPVDGRADLYALGIILYEWTAGRLPFEATDPVAVLTQHLHAPIVPPSAHNPDLSPALEALILRLLAKEPARRPASAAQVLEALEQLDQPERTVQPARELSLLDRIVRGRLVGRQSELAQARALWAQARAGQGQLLLVSGEPGVGKSRLVQELATQAVAAGGRALEGASYAEAGAPFAPFREILRQAVRTISAEGSLLPAQSLTNVLALAPDLRRLFPDRPQAAPGPANLEQGQLLEEILLLVSLLTEKKPLFILLEDTHWADSATLSALHHLARQTQHLPVMILATYREVEIDQARAFHQMLLDFSRERLGQRIKLGRLDRQGTEALLRVLFDEEITPDFLEGIYRETEGNPFFIEELSKHLVDSGRLVFEDGRWHHPPVAELGLPQSIQVAVQARVGALPSAAQSILELAAILGREFDFDTLVRAGGETEEAVIDALDDALAAQLVQELPEREVDTFSFVHALIPAVLVEGLRTLRRRRLHRQAAAALEVTQPEAYEALAHHFVEGAEIEKGTDYLIKAGDQARALYALQEAVDAYENALELLRENGQPAAAARLLMKLGLTYHYALDFEKSRQAYDEASALRQNAPSTDEQGLPPAPQSLRLLGFKPGSLDPSHTKAPAVRRLFSGLTRLNPEMDVLPDVAQSWEVFNSGQEYVFYLRADVTWSDGHPVTAADFELALKRALNPSTGSWLADMFYDVKNARQYHTGALADPNLLGVRSLDDFTLMIELERPTGHFLQLLTYAFPLPRHSLERWGEAWSAPDKLVTNGPFRLGAWVPDPDRPGILFETNPAYHGHFSGNVQQVKMSFYPEYSDASAVESRRFRLKEYEAGALDFAGLQALDPAEVRWARLGHAGELLPLPLLSTAVLNFDTRSPPFSDPRVRRAFALATDRDSLANRALDGLHVPTTGGFVPPGMPGHVPGIALPFDPDRARQLLAEAGYPGGRGFPDLSFVGPYWGEWSERQEALLATSWLEILGVRVTFKWLLNYFERLSRLGKGGAQMYISAWTADYPDPDNWLRVGVRAYSPAWKNDRYDGLIERARERLDQRERLELYRRAENILAEEVPFLPLFYRRELGLLQPWIKNTPWDPVSGEWFWQDIIIEPH